MNLWYFAKPKPQDWIKIRCDYSSDESLFEHGKVYDGCWIRLVDDDGNERVIKGIGSWTHGIRSVRILILYVNKKSPFMIRK